jgi:hypothetical protein
MNQEKHWDRIYRAKAPTEVSWYQPEARLSLELIHRVAPGLDASVLDVGGPCRCLHLWTVGVCTKVDSY